MAEPAEKTEISEIFIGRQPIFDRELQVVAYELLYRGNQQNNFAAVTDGEMATTQVLVNAFMEIGFDDLVGEHHAFINMTRSFILGEQLKSLPNDRVVIEILEDIEIDEEVISSVKALSEAGYSIALDDFVYHESLKPLVLLADIIKIDLMALSASEIEQHVLELKQYDVKLLAEKVETRQEYENCKALGFDYFQGYFFCKPQIIKGEKLPTNRVAILQLVSKIYDPEVTFQELDVLISRDVSLSYKLLRIINSAAYALPRKIDSMKQALTILGMKHIRNWVSMIAFSGIDDKPAELFQIAMIRAKMCESVGQSLGHKDSDAYFTVGLFSNLDALMDQPLEALVTPLPLSLEIKSALLDKAGEMGVVLSCVLAYENADWESVDHSQVDPHVIKNMYAMSLHWAREMSRELA
jgi:c-di-GMP phosphodiesterase